MEEGCLGTLGCIFKLAVHHRSKTSSKPFSPRVTYKFYSVQSLFMNGRCHVMGMASLKRKLVSFILHKVNIYSFLSDKNISSLLIPAGSLILFNP